MKKILLTIICVLLSFSIHAKTLKDYERQAESGNPESAFKLGIMYEFGLKDQVKPNLNKAIRYYEISYNNGEPKAAARLGVINYERSDTKKAIEYFKFGAEQGESLSEAYLGKILEKSGKSDTALRFYEKSVKKGNPYGKMFLGEYYLKNETKGSDNFIKGYALLVNANKVNKDAKIIISKYPYKFNKTEQETLRKYMRQYQ
jgi:TPR repeat protein